MEKEIPTFTFFYSNLEKWSPTDTFNFDGVVPAVEIFFSQGIENLKLQEKAVYYLCTKSMAVVKFYLSCKDKKRIKLIKYASSKHCSKIRYQIREDTQLPNRDSLCSEESKKYEIILLRNTPINVFNTLLLFYYKMCPCHIR